MHHCQRRILYPRVNRYSSDNCDRFCSRDAVWSDREYDAAMGTAAVCSKNQGVLEPGSKAQCATSVTDGLWMKDVSAASPTTMVRRVW
jgi:hypothetical protein